MQDEPAYCGLASLAMTLNTLNIDPRRTWKGPWRWWVPPGRDLLRWERLRASLPSFRKQRRALGRPLWSSPQPSHALSRVEAALPAPLHPCLPAIGPQPEP